MPIPKKKVRVQPQTIAKRCTALSSYLTREATPQYLDSPEMLYAIAQAQSAVNDLAKLLRLCAKQKKEEPYEPNWPDGSETEFFIPDEDPSPQAPTWGTR